MAKKPKDPIVPIRMDQDTQAALDRVVQWTRAETGIDTADRSTTVRKLIREADERIKRGEDER